MFEQLKSEHAREQEQIELLSRRLANGDIADSGFASLRALKQRLRELKEDVAILSIAIRVYERYGRS